MEPIHRSGAAGPRQRWMAVLARARRQELVAVIARVGGVPDVEVLKPAEVGTIMIEGRAGGSGARFNIGEAAVARCVIRTAKGTLGVAYVLGTDRHKSFLAAVLDGLLQDPVQQSRLLGEIERLGLEQESIRDARSRKAAATKVEFFTMVRGEG
jgi:alpha-D-ribose 1-methylphosphonate 5-triphosphate synthase subunit PhnG